MKDQVVRRLFADLLGAEFENRTGRFTVAPDEIVLRVDDYGVNFLTVDMFISLFGDLLPDELPVETPESPAPAGLPVAVLMRAHPLAADPAWLEHIVRWQSEGRIA